MCQKDTTLKSVHLPDGRDKHELNLHMKLHTPLPEQLRWSIHRQPKFKSKIHKSLVNKTEEIEKNNLHY